MESNEQKLFQFAKEGMIEDLDDLLSNNIDVHEPDIEGFTALHHAAKNGQLNCVRRLIKAGANIEAQDIQGQTALHYASAMGDSGCIKHLLKAGADVNLVLENVITCNERNQEFFRSATVFHQQTRLLKIAGSLENFDCVRLAMAYGHEESTKTLMAAGATSHMAVLHPMSLTRYKNEVPEDAKDSTENVLDFAEDHLQQRISLRFSLQEVLKGINSISKGLPWDVKNLDPESADLFANLLEEDCYELFDTRNMLVGEQGVGKTTIASFLVGKEPPEYTKPTDGIGLYRGLAFLDKEQKKWLSGEQEFTWEELVVSKTLKVNPLQQDIKPSSKRSKSLQNEPVKPSTSRPKIQSVKSTNGKESSIETDTELRSANVQPDPFKHDEKPLSISEESNVQMGCTCIEPSSSSLDVISSSPCLLTSNPDIKTLPSDDKTPITTYCIQPISVDDKPSTSYSDSQSLCMAIQPLSKAGVEEISTDVQFLSKRKLQTNTDKSGSKCRRISISTEKDSHNQCELLEHATDLVGISITKEKLLEKSWNVGKKRLHRLNIVPVIIWDFGGQDVFYATHQTFLTYRAIYLIVIDGSRSLDDIVQGEGQYLPGKSGRKTCKDYIKFWVKTILTYCKRISDGFPKLVIVATHKDKVPVDRVECVRNLIYDEIDTMFIDSNLKCHIVTSHRIFVNANDHKDPEMLLLKEVLTELAFKQPTWGELMPSCFLPLEMELSFLVEKKDKRVITTEYLKKINHLLAIRPLTDLELQLFLKVQHALGKLLYFPVQGLDTKIILAPTHLIDAFRSIVTDRQFCGTDPIRLTSWDDMASNGIIKKSVINHIWQKEEFRHFWDDRDYLIGLMIHLDILSEPRRYDRDGGLLSNDFYLVPSMVREIDTTVYFKSPNFHDRAICLSFICSNEILPPALCYRFITFCLTLWPLKRCVENIEKQMLFEDVAVVVVDCSLDMSVHCGEDRIIVRLIHEESKSLIPEDIATSIRECLTKTLTNISQLYQQFCVEQISGGDSCSQNSFAVKSCCASPQSPCIAPNILDMKENEQWNCPGHNLQHTARSLKAWFSPNKSVEECIDVALCPVADDMFLATCPTDLHLRRLSIELTLDDMRELFVYLGMKSTQWENLTFGKKVENAIFESLVTWQESSEEGTFNELKQAMENMGLTTHKLCKVLRERFIDFERTNTSMDRLPTDKDIDRLAPLVGDNSLHFLVELGLEFHDWEQIKYSCGKDLVNTNREILMRWKEKCINETRIKPSMRSIYKAFANVGKSQRIVEKYLNKQRF